ncbi:MAG: hypothetical protein NTW06_00620 [Candidatus Falkowbacteria bacterium]|nr:hypothetical protein [Candidatus Falkowbacteria bacterium]
MEIEVLVFGVPDFPEDRKKLIREELPRVIIDSAKPICSYEPENINVHLTKNVFQFNFEKQISILLITVPSIGPTVIQKIINSISRETKKIFPDFAVCSYFIETKLFCSIQR